MASDFELADFLNNVPPALAIPLVHLAPFISASSSALQISTWSSSYYHSWLALAAWWGLCLLIDATLRRFLPLLVFLVFVYVQSRQKTIDSLKPTTEHTLRSVISDLNVIQSLLPSFPPSSIAIPVLLRVVAISYIPYILLSLFVSLRVICAITGTVLFTWRAPWAIVLRSTVWRSAWFRWSIYKTCAFLTGQPLPEPTFSVQSTTNTTTTPVQSLRFLFTIHENQRWWMGLDWTAALLPGERPSWCSSSQQPLSPPNAFTLPANTTVYLPDGNTGRTLKRTATWKWEEPEWRVVVHKNGGGLSRVERPLPSIKDESTSPNSSRLLKAAGRLRDSASPPSVNLSAASDSNKSTPTTSENNDAISHEHTDPSDEDPLTDIDGWVYGDNKWEAQSNRGGMGKYTRFRRWTRVAIVFEEVESVPKGERGLDVVQKQNSDIALPAATEDVTPVPEIVIGNPPDSPLKQRLKMALNKSSE